MEQVKTFSEYAQEISNLIPDGNYFKDIKFPLVCPKCGMPTKVFSDRPYCDNFNCPGRVYGRILKYCESLNIKGVGEETIRQLVEMGKIKNPFDLYEVSKEDFCSVERKGEKHYEKFIAGLKARSVLDLYEILGALSIDYAAEKVWLNIVKAGFDTIEKLSNTTAVELDKAENVSLESAEYIIEGFRLYYPLIKNALEKGFISLRVSKESKITGKTIVMTGTHNPYSRNEWSDKVKKMGGFFGNSVTKNTDYLIIPTGSNPASSKAKDAKRLGVNVIDTIEFVKLLGE